MGDDTVNQLIGLLTSLGGKIEEVRVAVAVLDERSQAQAEGQDRIRRRLDRIESKTGEHEPIPDRQEFRMGSREWFGAVLRENKLGVGIVAGILGVLILRGEAQGLIDFIRVLVPGGGP